MRCPRNDDAAACSARALRRRRSARHPGRGAGAATANVGDRLYRGALTALALVLPLLLLTLLAELVVSAWPAIKQFGLPFVWNSVWDPVAGGVCAAPTVFCPAGPPPLRALLPGPLALRLG